jgi:hypothetical protein
LKRLALFPELEQVPLQSGKIDPVRNIVESHSLLQK